MNAHEQEKELQLVTNVMGTVKSFLGVVWDKIIESIHDYILNPDYRDIILYAPLARRGSLANRPFTTKLGYELAGGENSDDIIPLAAAMEIANCSITYIEDRIIDDDEFIGRKKALHKVHGVGLALLASNGLKSIARSIIFEYEEKCKRATFKKMINLFEDIFREVDLGQFLDITYGEKATATYEDARIINEMRTGEFIKKCAQMGAIYADADAETFAIISKAFRIYGTAVQDKNDYNDVMGVDGAPGSYGQDIRLYKKTKPIVKALELANEEQKEVLKRIFGKKDASEDEVRKVSDIIHECGAMEFVLRDINEASGKAIEALYLLPDSKAKEDAIGYFKALKYFEEIYRLFK
ncbi:MAG: polyprenyl synthetase family protein [Deltaproteobacteria bacterium]|nr:polyprenyl synthetase family protein [Deltaproteobacteria bacterium]